ncbi:MAG: serine/threonine-protein kinase, partial [Thermoanaerobaculia bacterium]
MPIEPDRVDEIFYQAQEVPPEARHAFLDEACADDPELRREVQSLLVSVEETGDDFLERPLIADFSASWTSPEGRRLGAFRLLREIGRGGMSRVFLAVRDDQEIHQEVAVKVLKWGIDTGEAVHRFRRERQILARLEHPYVARFLDGGTTDDGLPYVVMELVEGEPIDRFCETRRLTVRQRLELFRKVCSAVQFAHQNLIVHRDLKPGNILVTADGTPRLLDFGIAKLLHDGPVSAAAPIQSFLTAPGIHPMTLAYASPEQIRGEAVTTASDVYSLGVVLYQLLTGSRPYGEPNHSALELARAVCEQEATKPSTTVGRDGRDRARQRRLVGDLDSIVLKALEKDPGRRYGSVERLSEDVQRHLEGLTVTAREATIFYRAGRYLRRHRLETTAVLVVFLIILGFSIHSVIL